MKWTKFVLVSLGCSFVTGGAFAQETSGAPATQVAIVGEVKYIRVGPEITYLQLLTTDQQGNVIEWELERPTIDRSSYKAGKTTRAMPDARSVATGDTISIVVVPTSAMEPKGEIVSQTPVQQEIQ